MQPSCQGLCPGPQIPTAVTAYTRLASRAQCLLGPAALLPDTRPSKSHVRPRALSPVQAARLPRRHQYGRQERRCFCVRSDPVWEPKDGAAATAAEMPLSKMTMEAPKTTHH